MQLATAQALPSHRAPCSRSGALYPKRDVPLSPRHYKADHVIRFGAQLLPSIVAALKYVLRPVCRHSITGQCLPPSEYRRPPPVSTHHNGNSECRMPLSSTLIPSDSTGGRQSSVLLPPTCYSSSPPMHQANDCLWLAQSCWEPHHSVDVWDRGLAPTAITSGRPPGPVMVMWLWSVRAARCRWAAPICLSSTGGLY